MHFKSIENINKNATKIKAKTRLLFQILDLFSQRREDLVQDQSLHNTQAAIEQSLPKSRKSSTDSDTSLKCNCNNQKKGLLGIVHH